MKLSVSKNNQLIQEIDLNKEIVGITGETSFFMGRSSECHIHLDDPMISREHCRLIFNSGLWTIESLSSFGLVSINNSSLQNSTLNSGDIISVGPFSISVYIETSQIPSEELVEEVSEEPLEDISEASSETETVALSSDDMGEISIDDEELDSNDDQELTENDTEESNDMFGGENTEVEFPEENDGTEGFEFGEDSDQDSEEYDDGYDIAEMEDDDEKTQVVTSFANYYLEIFGEFAPFDKYNLDTNEITIGRDPEKVQVVLNDPEVSSVHAKIKRTNITCILEDLDSGNGTILNGERINQSVLSNGDEFIIGSTTFTFKVTSDFLDKEKSTLMPVEQNQEIEVEEIVEINDEDDDFLDDIEGGGEFGKVSEVKSASLFSKDALKDPQKRKKLLIGAVVLVGLWVLLGDEGAPKKKSPKKGAKEKSRLVDGAKTKKVDKRTKELAKKLRPEQVEYVEAQYRLASSLIYEGKYQPAMLEIERIHALIKEYKNSIQMYELAKKGAEDLESKEKKRLAEIAKEQRKEKVKLLLVDAKKATAEHRGEHARQLFSKILQLDPDNFDVAQMKLQLESYEREQERIAVEKAQKKAERIRQESLLRPGEDLYRNKKWHKAIIELEKFGREKGIDSDLVDKGVKMLEESKKKLDEIVLPSIGRARSLKEGQDLKGAYENYKKILDFDPTNREALSEIDEIKELLHNRSKKIYREAIISESLSDFNFAKEKFQEVQQVSPTDSEYYRKATDKLKEYVE